MDIFGIGAAIMGAAEIYFRAARRTGRTTQLLNSLNDGDRVYFLERNHLRSFKRLAKERNLDIECCVIPVNDIHDIYKMGTCQGRSVFDHSWVEAYHLLSIKHVNDTIRMHQTETSSYGEPHRSTAKQFEEQKWR